MNEQKLIDLETRLTYQEDHMQSIDKSLHDMKKQIEILTMTCQVLKEQLYEVQGIGTIDINADEKPPHY